MRTRAITTVVAGVWALSGGLAWAAPQAKARPADWKLDFAFKDPQRISIALPGNEEPTTFWYMLYTVTNNTGEDRQFYPSFSLVTNTLEVVEAGDNINPVVYDAIAARHKQEYPFFVSPNKVSGLLLQGQDNARTSAAVFTQFDAKADSITVYGGGLSGEIERALNPSFDEDQPESEENPRFFILRKTIAIQYDLPGDEESRRHASPIRRNRSWVLR